MASAIAATARGGDKPIAVGAAIPDCKLLGSDGKEYRLRDFKGKQGIIIAWYPKALTGG